MLTYKKHLLDDAGLYTDVTRFSYSENQYFHAVHANYNKHVWCSDVFRCKTYGYQRPVNKMPLFNWEFNEPATLTPVNKVFQNLWS